MKLDPDIRSLLDAERFDAIEDLWLTRLEASPLDTGFFAGVLQGLLQRGLGERAEFLLQLAAEAWREQGDPAQEQATLGALLPLWPESAFLRAAVLDSLRRLHPGSAALENLVQHFGLCDGAEPVAALQRVQAWLRFDLGRPVYLPSQGAGRVREHNLRLGMLRVDFSPPRELMSFRLGEAEQLLRVLEPGHFLVQKLEQPETLRQLAESAPGELLRRLFASLGTPLPSADVRAHLRDLVPSESWNPWWKRARTDPRLTVGAGTRPLCHWSDDAAAAADQLEAQFQRATAAEKLALARQHADRSDSFARLASAGLVAALDGLKVYDPGLALEILLCLEQLPPTTTPKLEVEELLQRDDIVPLLLGLRDRRARERALELVRAQRADWPVHYAELLDGESDARVLGLLYDALRQSATPELERRVAEALARPAKAPRLFLWLCREMPRRPELGALADWRFLRRLLDACTDPAFKGQRAALRDSLDADSIDRIVKALDAEQAAQLLAFLERDLGIEAQRTKALRELVIARHPRLRESGEEALYVTAAALERKRAEFEQLVRVDIPRNTDEIRKAAAHGDLRENFEYKSARARQEMLSSRAKGLHDELRRARPLDPDSIDTSAIRVGTRVRLTPRSSGGSPLELTILGPWDSEPAQGIISYLAPAVAPLRGQPRGASVRCGEQDCVVAASAGWCRGRRLRAAAA